MAKKRVPKKVKKIVRNYIERLAKEKELPIKKVILYGSRAKGNQKKDSDIDLCIISPKFKDALNAIEFLLLQRNRQEVMVGLEPVGFSEKDFKSKRFLLSTTTR